MRRELQGAGNEMDDILARAACDSRMTPVIEDIAKDIENEIALRRVAGAYQRSSLIFLTHSGNSGLG
jgi:hypothetical protein